jgi:hypothetical protein
MGAMSAFDKDYAVKPRGFNLADEIVHGIRTVPNPFPNPLKGPGVYSDLGLSDEDLMKLRDRVHVIPVMVNALGLSEEVAGEIFDDVAHDQNRELISVIEFLQAYRRRS